MKKAPPPRWRYAALLCFAFLVVTQKGRAQVETDTSFRYQMNTIFGPLDKSKVPYGILRDYAMEFVNLEYYNGTATLADSNYASPGSFWQVYNTLLTGRIHSSASGLLVSDTVDSRWYTQRVPGQITLTGLFFNYSRFRDDAYPNYITITSNKLYDKYVSGVWQNPYQSEKVFLISPPVLRYSQQSFTLLLPANLWFTNTTHAGLSIDMDDGAGYRTLTPGTAISITYASSGVKEWKYRLTLSGGGYLYAHSRVTIGYDTAQ